MLASSSQVLKELWKRVSDTSISFPLYFLHYYFFLRGRLERRKKYGFPNRKEIWTVVTFPINWPGFSTAPLHRCGIKLVNLDFYVSNFLAFRAVWEPSKRFISNIRNIVPKEFLIPFGQFLIFQSRSWSSKSTDCEHTLYIVHLTLDNNLVWAYFKDGQYLNEEYNWIPKSFTNCSLFI